VYNDGEQCLNYIRDPTKVIGPIFEWGTCGGMQGKSKDSEVFCQELLKGVPLKQLALQMPSTYIRNCNGYKDIAKMYQSTLPPEPFKAKTVICWYGPTGSGKTKAAYDYCINKQIKPAWITPPMCKNSTVFFDDYIDQKILIIDEFYGWLYAQLLLRIMDGYPFTCNIKGSTATAQFDTVLITSCKHPLLWYKDKDNKIAPQIKRRITEIIELPLPVPTPPPEKEFQASQDWLTDDIVISEK